MDKKRVNKGKSKLILPKDYCVVDIETTGLTPSDSEIIEIAAVRYRDHEKSDSFCTFVKSERPIPEFIVGLTGITNEMIADAPDISEAILGFSDFVGGDIIMGYNVNFDINFLYDALLKCHGVILSNNFVDILRFARKALPNLERRSQTRVADHLKISSKGAHRADVDCEICNAIYQKLRGYECIKEMTKEKSSADE